MQHWQKVKSTRVNLFARNKGERKEGSKQGKKAIIIWMAPWSPRVNFENDDFKCKKIYFFYLEKIFYLFTAIAECKKQRQLIILRGFTGLLPISWLRCFPACFVYIFASVSVWRIFIYFIKNSSLLSPKKIFVNGDFGFEENSVMVWFEHLFLQVRWSASDGRVQQQHKCLIRKKLYSTHHSGLL